MYSISQRSRLAIAIVVAVAAQPEGRRVTSVDIAKSVGVPRRVLESLLQTLVHGKILKSQTGPRGGYRLGCSGMTIKNILDALDQLDELMGLRAHSAIASQVVLPALREAEFGFANALDRIKVERLAAIGSIRM